MPDSSNSDYGDDGVVDFYLENYHEFEATAQYEAWFAGTGEPFDFTGTSYLDEFTRPLRDGPTRLSIEFDDRVETARQFMSEHGGWPKLDEENLAMILELDEQIFEEGDQFLQNDPAVLDDEEKIKLCAAGKELSRVRPGDRKLLVAGIEFWGRLHQLGASPEMVREANHLLHIRGGDAAWLEDYGELREANSNFACLEYLHGVSAGDGREAVRRDIEGDMAGGIAQLHYGVGAMEEKEGSGVATRLLAALVTRDATSANRVFDKDASDREARARKAGFRTYTAFEAERVIGSTDPAAVADTSFLRIRVVERALARRTPVTARSLSGFAPVRRGCARARTSHLRGRPGSRRATARSRSSGDGDDGGGGGSDPPARRWNPAVTRGAFHDRRRESIAASLVTGHRGIGRLNFAVALIGLLAALIGLAGAVISVSGSAPAGRPVPVLQVLCADQRPWTIAPCVEVQRALDEPSAGLVP
jgi:hypothetical protein